jgi:hypothetical protein
MHLPPYKAATSRSSLFAAPTACAGYEDSNSASWISSSMVAEKISRSQSDESASFVVPDDAIDDILSAI